MLFTKDLRGLTAEWTRLAILDAQGLTDEQVLGGTVEQLAQDVMARHNLVVPDLESQRREISEGGSQDEVRLHVPFTGDALLVEYAPNLFFSSGPPNGKVQGSEVVVDLGSADGGITNRADQWTATVEQLLEQMRHDLQAWRGETRATVLTWVVRRRSEAESHKNGLEQVGIPIRPRDSAPAVFRQPAIARRATPRRETEKEPTEPEPALSAEYYDHIISVIRAAGKAMERSPETYSGWGEEDRRQNMILMLNTHYAGNVFAEAFNGDGKTDILIREDDKNVFVGECKFYEGPQSVHETLDQIFGYATWRDVKLAIVFFVDRLGFTEALDRIRSAVGDSEQFRDWIGTTEETELRAEMIWPGDPQRIVTLHVSSFHTPRSS